MLNKIILIVEDDKDLNEYLTELLNINGYSVFSTEGGIRALKIVQECVPDLIVLDLTLSDISGIDICKKVKKDFPNIKIVMLTGKTETSDIVSGLNVGADDYMTKPFSGEELLARIKVQLRGNNLSSKIKVADLEIDTDSIEVKRGDKKIELTPQEFKLLTYMAQNKNRVLTRDVILTRLWDSAGGGIESRVVDVYVGYLRKKIDSRHKTKLIHSVRGFGYVLKES